MTSADQSLVERANAAIDAGTLVNIGGQPVKKKLDSGLVRAAGDLMYPVVDQIPVMLPDEAIAVSQLD